MNPYFSNEEITLYHGDCAGIEVQCDLIVTDPPYGQEFKSVGRWHDGITPEQISEQLSSARAALQSVEGAIQGSIATKQESCPESAPRTETTVRDWRKSVFTYEHDDAAGHLYYFAPQVTAPGPFLEQRHVQAIVDIASDGTFAGVELIDNMPPLNSGGADTESDGGTSPSNETRGGAGDDCSVGKRGAWPHHDGQVCAQRLNVENQNPDVTGGESAAPNSPAVAEARRAGSAGLSPGDGFSDPAPSRVEER